MDGHDRTSALAEHRKSRTFQLDCKVGSRIAGDMDQAGILN